MHPVTAEICFISHSSTVLVLTLEFEWFFFTMHESWRAVVWIESEWETEVPKCGHEWRLTSMLGTWTATMTIMHAIWRDYMVRLPRIFDLFVSAPMHFKIGRLFAANILILYVYVYVGFELNQNIRHWTRSEINNLKSKHTQTPFRPTDNG